MILKYDFESKWYDFNSRFFFFVSFAADKMIVSLKV